MDVTLALGILLLTGLLGGTIALRLGMPSVTGYILLGLVAGPSMLGLVTTGASEALQPLNLIALGVVAMTIGGELKLGFFRRLAGQLVAPFVGEVILTFALVASGTALLTGSIPMGIVLGVVGMSTAPSAILSIIREEEQTPGPFSRSLLALVALDSLFCIIAFGVVMGLGPVWSGTSGGGLVWQSLANIGLSVGLGVVLGLGLAAASIWQLGDDKLLVLVLGSLSAAVGLGHSLGLSPLLIAMVAGAVIANLPTRAWRPFSALRKVELPVLISFLTLAGTRLDTAQLVQVGPLALAYMVLRVSGKVLGAYLGSVAARVPRSYRWNLGLGLTPQAGVAAGLAVFAEAHLPFAAGLTTLVLSAVIVLEILTPPLVRRALRTADRERNGALGDLHRDQGASISGSG